MIEISIVLVVLAVAWVLLDWRHSRIRRRRQSEERLHRYLMRLDADQRTADRETRTRLTWSRDRATADRKRGAR